MYTKYYRDMSGGDFLVNQHVVVDLLRNTDCDIGVINC